MNLLLCLPDAMLGAAPRRAPFCGKKRGQVKYLLEVMRLFHYMVGITTPRPEDERKILFLWMGILVVLVALAVGLFLFLVPHVLR
jgi:hypothetical protein